MDTVTRRGQLVVLAGAVVAVALIPVLVAALQLGAGPVPVTDEPAIRPSERFLESAVADAAPLTLEYAWDDRVNASARLQDAVAKSITELEDSAGPRVLNISYAAALAHSVAQTECPTGPNREFGACTAVDGVVLQNRANTTHVVAVAFRVTVVSADGRTAVTVVVRPPVRVRGEARPRPRYRLPARGP